MVIASKHLEAMGVANKIIGKRRGSPLVFSKRWDRYLCLASLFVVSGGGLTEWTYVDLRGLTKWTYVTY